MATTLTLADLPPPIVGDDAPAQVPPVDTPTPQYSAAQNVAAGAVSPVIAAANLGLQGAHALAPSVIGQHTIPEIPHDPGVEYTAGNIAGLGATQFIPGLDIASDIGEGAEGAGLVGKLASKIPQFGQRAAKGAAIGYTTTPGDAATRGTSALMGGAGFAAAPAIGKVIKIPASVLKRVSKNIVGKAVNPLQDFIHNSISGRIGNTTAENSMGKAYKNAKDAVNWESLQGLAHQADQSKTAPFNPLSYGINAHNILGEANRLASKNKSLYSTLPAKIQERIDNTPNSFSDVIAEKKHINELPGSWDATTNNKTITKSRELSGLLGQALDKNVEEEATTPEAQNFKNQWQAQRQNYGNLQQFYNNPNKTASFDPTLKNDLENGNYSSVVQRYIPTKDQESGDAAVDLNNAHTKINQFRNLVGDHDVADKALLNQFLQKYRDPNTGTINSLKLGKDLNQGKISQTMMPLLTHDEKVGIGNITHVNNVANSLNKSTGIVKSIAAHPIWGGMLAGALAHHMGLPYEALTPAALAGAFGPKEIIKALSKHYENHANKLLNSGRLDKLKELSDLFDEKGRPVESPPPSSIIGKLAPKVGAGALLTPGHSLSQLPQS